MKTTFERFVKQTIRYLSTDPRFCGLAIAGSWISDEIDEFSDLDLVVVCKGKEIAIPDRMEVIKNFGDLVSAFPGDHVGETRLMICLFRDPLIHVDIKFVALKDFADRIENPHIAWEAEGQLTKALSETAPRELKPDLQWIENRFWTWVHYGATKIARGELFEAISFLSFLRERVLGPLCLWVHGKPVRGVRRIEQYLPEFALKLQKTVPSYDKKSCADALLATVELYRELRTRSAEKEFEAREIAESECEAYLSKDQWPK